jgi:hypothetical protein
MFLNPGVGIMHIYIYILSASPFRHSDMDFCVAHVKLLWRFLATSEPQQEKIKLLVLGFRSG